MNKEELSVVLDKHRKWLFNEDSGERADLSGAYLSGAYLRGADLSGAYLSGAYLRGANLDEYTKIENDTLNKYFPIACPDTGGFVGWKKCRNDRIVKLFIPEDAKRSSAFGRKCRCDKALVLDVQDLEGNSLDETAYSWFSQFFNYTKGQEVSVADFNEDRKQECSSGIHFFITRQEAVNYQL